MGQKQQVKGKVVPTGKKGEEEMDESKKLLQQVKDAGVAGIISYIFCAPLPPARARSPPPHASATPRL